MSTDDFRELYIKLVENCGIEPETARLILQKIMDILNESGGKEQEK